VTVAFPVLNSHLKVVVYFLLKQDKVGNVPDNDSLFVVVLETWRPGVEEGSLTC
jgi:hypothetical protein